MTNRSADFGKLRFVLRGMARSLPPSLDVEPAIDGARLGRDRKEADRSDPQHKAVRYSCDTACFASNRRII